MKRMSSGGFTIVESMVVLGVTGLLFISLAAMTSGQQSKARFRAAMTDIVTQIQSQINEVATGYYPNASNFSCSTRTGSVNVTGGANAQGTNSDCTFLGRALMYAQRNPAGDPVDPEQYGIYTLVGMRKVSGREPLTLAEAGTRPLAPGVRYNSGWTDLTEVKTLSHGVQAVSMKSKGVLQDLAGFAVVAAPNQQVAYDSAGVAESGTVIPSIIPIPRGTGAAVGLTPKANADALVEALGLPTSTADASQGPIEICFRSGTTNQSALVVIGINGSTTAVDYTISNTVDCT